MTTVGEAADGREDRGGGSGDGPADAEDRVAPYRSLLDAVGVDEPDEQRVLVDALIHARETGPAYLRVAIDLGSAQEQTARTAWDLFSSSSKAAPPSLRMEARRILGAHRPGVVRSRDQEEGAEGPPDSPGVSHAESHRQGIPGDRKALTDEERERIIQQQPSSVKKAYGGFLHACAVEERPLTDKEAWKWLEDRGEAPDCKRETWERCLRLARSAIGDQKHKRRLPPEPGRNVVRRRDLD